MKLVPLTAILLLSACIFTQRVSAGPLDTIRNFFGARPQPQAHVHHPRPVHPKEAKDAKDAPNESPSPIVSQGEQQPNGSPGPSPLNNATNRAGRPDIKAAPLY
jgi:hypothetical protein